jgi:hypothetical protein
MQVGHGKSGSVWRSGIPPTLRSGGSNGKPKYELTSDFPSRAGPRTAGSHGRVPASPYRGKVEAPSPKTCVARQWKVRVSFAGLAVAFASCAVAAFIRAWLVFHNPSSSDEAIVGLMAQSGMHGHFQAFYSGQQYGGTAEPYLIGFAFILFGRTAVVAELAVVALAAGAAVLVWRIMLRLVPEPTLAVLAGALVWSAPAVSVRDSTHVYGFRGVTDVCGLAAMLVALRIFDGCKRALEFVGIGLVMGIGWWSSPEIAYFAIPILLILRYGFIKSQRPRLRTWGSRFGLALGAFAIGSLPWMWANIRSGFVSLQTPGAAPPPASFTGRFSIFFHHVLPTVLGVAQVGNGASLLGSAHTTVLVGGLLLLGATLVLCMARGGPTLAIAVGVVSFPVLYAIWPATWFWRDGRYANYLPPLMAIVLVCGVREASRRLDISRIWPILGATVISLLAVLVSVSDMRSAIATDAATFTSSWGNPDDPTSATVNELRTAGITTGYANYWVAYKLDFVSNGTLTITTAGRETDRSSAIDSVVTRSPHPAWLFVPKSEGFRDGTQFGKQPVIGGLDAVTEQQFLDTLHHLGVPYRVVDTGLLRAVIPARKLTPYEAELPGAAGPRARHE